MGVLTQLLCFSSMLSCFSDFNNVTIHNEGVYIPFPSCAFKQSNLELNSIYFTLTILNAFYLLRTRAIRSRSVYIIQVRFIKLLHLCSCNNSKVNLKICDGACPAVSCFRVGSLDVGDAPASKTHKDLKWIVT
jgi:hypothetical protein